MDYRKILNVSFFISLGGTVFGCVLVYFSEKIFFCTLEQSSTCIFGIGEPLLFSSMQLGIIFLALRFLSKEIFNTWLCFASWYIPLAAVWIFITPAYGGAFLSQSKEGIVWTLGGIYMSVSIIIILVRLAMLKMQKKKKSR